MKMTKEQALAKIEKLKKYVDDQEETKTVGVQIKTIVGTVLFQSTKTTVKEAVVEAVESGADLRDANLYRADLRYANLRDADLYGANLYGANLYGADLSGANLSGAYLRNADLSGANLSNAYLRDAYLRDADLYEADLRDSELASAKFYGKGGTQKLKRSQLPDFLGALGFVIEEDV